MKINLQLFADEVETAEVPETKTYTQEELERITQIESDRKVSKALETSRVKWEEETRLKIEAERREAEELAKLSEKEKMAKEIETEQNKLAEERKQFYKERLEMQTEKELMKENLPVEFSTFVIGTDAEDTQKRISVFKTKFQEAVEATVNNKLKGTAPKTGDKLSTIDTLTKQLESAKSLDERIMIKREITKLQGE